MANLPVIDMVRTGQNIGRLRKQAGLSVRDLQDIFGFATPQAIYKWQQGAALPTLDNLYALSRLLMVPMDTLVAASDQTEPAEVCGRYELAVLPRLGMRRILVRYSELLSTSL